MGGVGSYVQAHHEREYLSWDGWEYSDQCSGRDECVSRVPCWGGISVPVCHVDLNQCTIGKVGLSVPLLIERVEIFVPCNM